MSSSRVMNIFFLLPCQCFIAVVGNTGKLSQHSSASLDSLNNFRLALEPRGLCVLMLLLPKKDKGKIGGFKNLWGRWGVCVCGIRCV